MGDDGRQGRGSSIRRAIARPRATASLFVLLLAVWLVANASLSISVIATGAAASLAIALVCAPGEAWRDLRPSPRRARHFAAYLGTFLVELVKANIAMLGYVYARRLAIAPGVVEARTSLVSPIGRLALANSIALTPGSLVLDLEADRLVIHLLDVETQNVEAVTRVVVTPFERHLEKVFG